MSDPMSSSPAAPAPPRTPAPSLTARSQQTAATDSAWGEVINKMTMSHLTHVICHGREPRLVHALGATAYMLHRYLAHNADDQGQIVLDVAAAARCRCDSCVHGTDCYCWQEGAPWPTS